MELKVYFYQYAFYLVAFILSLIISSLVIRKLLPRFGTQDKKDADKEVRIRRKWYFDVGFWIGFFETLIIFVFVANSEFSGLAIIFAAKEFVRKEEIKKDPVYYLLGTLVNFGIALLMAEVGRLSVMFIPF